MFARSFFKRCSLPQCYDLFAQCDKTCVTGPAPIYYRAGYISGKDFWRLGFIFGVIFIVALLGISAPIMLATS
jgi:hypothetical protein